MSNVTFIPSSTATVMPLSEAALAFTLPAVDGGNPDLQISCTGYPAWLSFGPGAVASANGVSSIMVTPTYTLLLTSNAAVLAAAANNSNVRTGAAATQAATQTAFSAIANMRGGSVTIQRGLASAGGRY